MRTKLPQKTCNRCGKNIDRRNTKGLCLTCFTQEQALILSVKHYCPCGAEVYHKGSLCKPCANIALSNRNTGANNPNYRHGLNTKKEK